MTLKITKQINTPGQNAVSEQVLHTVKVRTWGRYSQCIATDGSFKSEHFSQQCKWQWVKRSSTPSRKDFSINRYRGADKSLARPDWKKEQLKGRRFSSDAEVTAAAETWLGGQPSEFFFKWLA